MRWQAFNLNLELWPFKVVKPHAGLMVCKLLQIKLPCTPAGLTAAKALTTHQQGAVPPPSITITGVHQQALGIRHAEALPAAHLGRSGDCMAPAFRRQPLTTLDVVHS
jgi:hypothetical protein